MTEPQISSYQHASWSSGAGYEPFVGRWSRLVAREFLGWMAISAGYQWLDVGCGTGALTETILAMASPATIKGVDPSPEYISYARGRITDVRASFETGDAQALPVETGAYDAAICGLVLNFVAEPERAVSEMKRVVRPGGMVACYVWDYADKMELLRYFWNSAIALNSASSSLDEGQRFPICKPEPLSTLFHGAGLRNVVTRAIDVPTHFQDFADYWTPFLGGQGPAPGYALSLNEDERTMLREHLRAALPISKDGSIHLIARAWAIRGTTD